MTNYAASIRQARIKASSPEAIAEYLCARSQEEILEDMDELDPYLANINSPLINIALAQYCGSEEVIENLYIKNRNDRSIKVACLANQNIKLSSRRSFPFSVFDFYEKNINEFFHKDHILIDALFSNPSINEEFLLDFLNKKFGWDGVEESVTLKIAESLSRNKIYEKHKKTYLFVDGLFDDDLRYWYIHDKILHATVNLASHVPVNDDWASVLADIFEKIPNQKIEIEGYSVLLKRWRDPSPLDKKHSYIFFNKYWVLSPYQRIRKMITIFADKDKDLDKFRSRHSKNLVTRCASYQSADQSLFSVFWGLRRDRFLAHSHFVKNPKCWQSKLIYQMIERYAQFYYTIDDDNYVQFLSILKNNVKDRPYFFNLRSKLLASSDENFINREAFEKLIALRSMSLTAFFVIIFMIILR